MTRIPRLVRGSGLSLAGHTRPHLLTLASALLGALALAAPGAHAFIQPADPLVRTIALGRLPDALALDPGSGRAFVADDAAATVSVLDLAAGRLVRTVAVGPPGRLAPLALALALDTHTHRLFAANRGDGSAPGTVRVLDSRSGASLRTVQVGPEASALVVDERAGHVFVTAQGDGSVSMLDARSGAVLRTMAVGFTPVALAVDARLSRAFVVSWAIRQGHEMGSGRVSILDTRTGALVSTVAVGDGSTAVVVDTRTRRAFVINNGDNTVSVLDARSGAVLRTVAVGWGPAALAVDARQGRVFVVNAGDGSLSVLDARSGVLLRTRPIFGEVTASAMTLPYALAVDAIRARVYMTAWGRLDQAGLPTGSGQLAVLDAHDGRLLRMIAVGVAPRAVAVDTLNGRVMVVASGGAMRAPLGWLERWEQQVAGWAPWLGRIVPRSPNVVMAPSGVQVIDAAGR